MNSMVMDIPKNSFEVIRLQPTEFNEYHLYDIRVFYRNKETGEYKPCQKGISFRRHLLPEVMLALQKLAEEEEPPCGPTTLPPDRDTLPPG